MPTERPQPATNMNQPDHHAAPPAHALPLPPQHMNYYPNRENSIPNQPPPNQPSPAFTQNSTIPLASRRRSFGMIESNIEIKRPHLEDIRTMTVSNTTYNTQNADTSHQCRFVEQIGQAVNSASAPNSVGQVQQQQQPQPQPISAQPVASVVISEDVINIYRLYEEHHLLRRRVEINEERLQELRATNTYLLQQNEQLRRQTQCSCANTIVNPVTLTTASQQSAAPVNTHMPNNQLQEEFFHVIHFLFTFRF